MSGTVPAPIPPTPFPALPTSTVTDVPTFRSHFPAFANTAIYPDAMAQMFIDTGSAMFNAQRWGYYLSMAVELFTAHMLALCQYAAMRATSGAGGGMAMPPGIASGLLSSKSVSKVSVGYDVGVTAMEGAGPWNYTIYGQQLIWWANLIGTGGYETLAMSGGGLAGTIVGWATGVMSQWMH